MKGPAFGALTATSSLARYELPALRGHGSPDFDRLAPEVIARGFQQG